MHCTQTFIHTYTLNRLHIPACLHFIVRCELPEAQDAGKTPKYIPLANVSLSPLSPLSSLFYCTVVIEARLFANETVTNVCAKSLLIRQSHMYCCIYIKPFWLHCAKYNWVNIPQQTMLYTVTLGYNGKTLKWLEINKLTLSWCHLFRVM